LPDLYPKKHGKMRIAATASLIIEAARSTTLPDIIAVLDGGDLLWLLEDGGSEANREFLMDFRDTYRSMPLNEYIKTAEGLGYAVVGRAPHDRTGSITYLGRRHDAAFVAAHEIGGEVVDACRFSMHPTDSDPIFRFVLRSVYCVDGLSLADTIFRLAAPQAAPRWPQEGLRGRKWLPLVLPQEVRRLDQESADLHACRVAIHSLAATRARHVEAEWLAIVGFQHPRESSDVDAVAPAGNSDRSRAAHG